MKPFLVEGAKILGDEVRVAQLNVDEEPGVAGAFGIRSIPTLVLMRGAQVVSSVKGVMPAASLVNWVRAELAKGGGE